MRQCRQIFSLMFFVFFSTFGFADELHQQVTLTTLQPPTPLKANDHFFLVYEDMLTNFEKSPITLTSVQVNQFPFTDKILESMLHDIASHLQLDDKKYRLNFRSANNNHPKKITIRIGSNSENNNHLTLKSGESKLIYVWLPFDALNKIPDALKQTINYQINDEDSDKTENFSIDALPVFIKKTAPIIVHPPLKGEHWLAANGPSNTSAHRMSHIVLNGHIYFPQRYAIDFIQIDNAGKSFHGDESNNHSYYCYGKDVYAVGNGRIVEVLDGLPENIPHSGKLAVNINFKTAGGNHVIIQLDKNHYAFYAHLLPGSITVKVGDLVKTGQVIGKLGNTGNSSEPHLHFHIVDGPSFLGANGLPYAFDNFRVDNRDANGKTTAAAPLKKTNQLVLENTVVNF